MYNTPILFLIFSRPDTTQQVFNQIREIKPKRLYIAADAAREGRRDEAERCKQTRAIIEQIDWDCEVKKLFRDKNLGCKIAVSEAITWFFEQEEYGVILEDDCLPDLSFFPFCEELLLKYKDDDRIGHIGGNNFFPGIVNESFSYDFCSFTHIWGWASWRRVWKNYDVKFPYWEKAQNNKGMKDSLFNNWEEQVYFSSFLSDTLYENASINTWDVQYFFMLRTQSQLSIYPAVNMVSNIGLNDINATHTLSKKSKKMSMALGTISFPLVHPQYIISNHKIDTITVRKKTFSYKRLLRYIFKLY